MIPLFFFQMYSDYTLCLHAMPNLLKIFFVKY